MIFLENKKSEQKNEYSKPLESLKRQTQQDGTMMVNPTNTITVHREGLLKAVTL